MVEIYRLAKALPDYEKFAMAKQLGDASLSMPGNIAEAFGHHHHKDNINFYIFSRGSAHECVSHLLCTISVDHFNPPEIEVAVPKCHEVIEDHNKIIKNTQQPLKIPSPQPKPLLYPKSLNHNHPQLSPSALNLNLLL